MRREMYLVEMTRSSAARTNGQKVRPVLVSEGRKYFTLPGSRPCHDLKFEREENTDVNGNTWYFQVSEYSREYVLYETHEGARDYLRREELLHEIRQCNFDAFDVGTLSDIVSAINAFREKVKNKRREEQWT